MSTVDLAQAQERILNAGMELEQRQKSYNAFAQRLATAAARIESIDKMLRTGTMALEAPSEGRFHPDDPERIVMVANPDADLDAAREAARSEVRYWLREYATGVPLMIAARDAVFAQARVVDQIQEEVRPALVELGMERARLREQRPVSNPPGAQPGADLGRS